MTFIDIDGRIVNVESIVSVEKTVSKYDSGIITSTTIRTSDGFAFDCAKEYYAKLHSYLKPVVFVKD